MVQVVAARRLFERGIMLKDGSALERLAEIDTVVFDKTGTLTLGMPRLVNSDTIDPEALATAAAIAAHSRHPYSRALASAKADTRIPLIVSSAVAEHPGSGLEARLSSGTYRLGRPDWAIGSANPSTPDANSANVVLSRDGQLIAAFAFDEQLREGTGLAIADLRRMGFAVEILSGDHDEAVRRIAEAFDIPYVANVSPADKATHIGRMQASGRKPLLVGDGLNDAPALVAAHASMAPASGADVGRNAADLIFMHESLTAVPTAVQIAQSAGRLVRQNLALAAGYNAIAVPVSIFGHVTPLVAAIAMSLSSLAVVGNALRLRNSDRAVAPSRNLRFVSPQPIAQ
jgi:Cu2+-exporting ATPase